jgi:hypothetical protein
MDNYISFYSQAKGHISFNAEQMNDRFSNGTPAHRIKIKIKDKGNSKMVDTYSVAPKVSNVNQTNKSRYPCYSGSSK